MISHCKHEDIPQHKSSHRFLSKKVRDAHPSQQITLEDLERDVIILGIDLALPGPHLLRLLGLQEMDPDSVTEQPIQEPSSEKQLSSMHHHYPFRPAFSLDALLFSLPCTVEVERAGPPDGDEPEDVLVEIHGLFHGSAQERDVVQGLEVQGVLRALPHLPEQLHSNNQKL